LTNATVWLALEVASKAEDEAGISAIVPKIPEAGMKSLFLTLAVATVINSGIICAQTSDSQARTTQQNKSPSELPEIGLNDHPEAQIPDHIFFLLYFNI
jgi:hypothetical protein